MRTRGSSEPNWLERWQTRLVKRTFEAGALAEGVQWLQSHVGQHWIILATSRLHHLHHLERLPEFDPRSSYIIVANHRSLFDLYIIVANLVRRGLRHRILFPVRSTFFYDHPLGLFVNGAMSFFAMYPPIYRDKRKAPLNARALEEVAELLRRGGHLVGFHPEGTRNRKNPYQLLPMRHGVGRLIHAAKVPVIPVFTNGLRVENLPKQISSNFDGTGTPIHTVFGTPLELDDLLAQPGSPAVWKQIAERVGVALRALAEEERGLRAAAGDPPFEG